MLEILPAQLAVFLSAMLPVLELRFAIPYGVVALDMHPIEALVWGLAGNLLIALILIRFLDPVTTLLRKQLPFMDRFFERLFQKTRHKHSKKMTELGHLALTLFVAVPLPGSGAWTGSLVAYVFGVKQRTSILTISLGLLIAACLITFGTEGIILAVQSVLGG